MVEKLVAAIRGLIRIAERSKTSTGCRGPGRAARGSGYKGTLLGAKFHLDERAVGKP